MKRKFRTQWLIGPLTRRLIALLLVVILVPALALSAVIFSSISRSYTKQLVSDRRMMLQQTTGQIDASLLSIQNRCKYIADNNLVINLLRKGDLTEYPVYTKHYVQDIVAVLRHIFDYQILVYRDICIFSDVSGLPEGSIFHSQANLASAGFWPDVPPETGRMNLMLLDRTEAAQYYAAKDGSQPRLNNLALMVYVIYDHQHGKALGHLVMELSPNNLFSRMFDTSAYYLLFPGSGYSCGAIPAGVTSADVLDATDGFVQAGGKTFAVASSGRFGYLLVDSQGVSAQQQVPYAVSFALLTLVVALMIILGFLLLIRYFLKRINESISSMDTIIGNRFHGHIEPVRTDELGQIDERFNRMLEEISAQTDKLMSEVEAKKAAQYEALRQQLNPHFIYNTLNLFSGAAQQSQQTALGDAIAFFGHLLHYNLKDTGDYAFLYEELDNARSLIEVYALDEEKRISLQIDVPDELQALRVMKHLIQPLVENSISHGLRRGQMLNIRISGWMAGEQLTIEVEDDGNGIQKERLVQIEAILSDHEDAGDTAAPGHLFIGLNNIIKRLRLFYGNDASLQIDSEPAQYTRVRVSLPAVLTSEKAPEESR